MNRSTYNHSNLSFQLSRYAFAVFAFFFLITANANAQLPKELPAAASSGKANAGSLLTQFANAIKPSSFTDEWSGQKGNWLSTAGKIASAPGFASSVASLTKFIKPSMFKDAFKPENLIKTASTAKSMADATGLLKSLEGGLKPEAMVAGWAGKKSSWLSALSLLK